MGLEDQASVQREGAGPKVKMKKSGQRGKQRRKELVNPEIWSLA